MTPLIFDKQLIEKCRSADRKAQRALVAYFSRPMFLHCYRYLKDKSDTEEVVSDGFVKVFQHITDVDYRDKPSFEGWIRRIMINEALGFLRKRKKLMYVDEKEQELIPEQLSVDESLAAEDIYQLILSLPVKYRTVFNMYAIEGYTHQEIAAILEITESTSRSQLARARKMLQELMVKINERYDTGRV
ncbi:RNA polymerase sigma factor [Cytophagaceae bacterium DM2B3-1]|uniref:RNA polymerase sigma factor n=1 Tax=Xanthocytophaga flava TaxID=3048013 RepID=A0ABT7CTJ0_9BACT|nr:RNA polymerase sigma factor [Xanthocytophaga flavus]MDJ1472207.1 RNA polymerase sigma factor [Xanthocytophaga flavus]MDJ1496991.1 RNA polymerase sigma factor [Xanthocytophaga flavus]